jgi:hypothetical protein
VITPRLAFQAFGAIGNLALSNGQQNLTTDDTDRTDADYQKISGISALSAISGRLLFPANC